MALTPLSAAVLAEEVKKYSYDTLKPGPMAFVVTAFLAVAVFFLIRSLVKQLRRVRFDESAATDSERAASHERAAQRNAKDAGPGA